jgi:hypothetical protein
VAVALFAFYVAVQRGRLKSYDASIMVHLATRILTEHTLSIDPAADKLHLMSPYTSYGFGTTLLALPFDALQRAVAPRARSWLTLANPMVLAACGALLFLIGRRLGWRASTCVATALGFGLLTPALWQSTELFSEPGVALASLLLVFGALSWPVASDMGAVLVGVGAAMAVLFRPDSLVLIVPLALFIPFIVPRDLLLSRRALLRMGAPVAAFGAFQLWYNNYRFGSVFNAGLSHQTEGKGFNTPILQGLDLLLRSPSRGFFWTAPILLLALPGILFLYRRSRPLALAIGAVVIARFLFFAAWWTPGGGIAWGPRLLFPAAALLAIPAGEALENIHQWRSTRNRRIGWASIASIATLSAAVALLSIAVGYEQYWNQWTRVPKPLKPQRAHDYYWSLAHNAIAGNIHLLRSGNPIAPIHFRNGIDAIGVVSLAVAALATVTAFAWRESNPQTSDP